MDKVSPQIIKDKSLFASAKKEMMMAFVSGILVAAFTYLFGIFDDTVALNHILEFLKISDLDAEQLAESRQDYALTWNSFHMLRTGFPILSFLISLSMVLRYSKIF